MHEPCGTPVCTIFEFDRTFVKLVLAVRPLIYPACQWIAQLLILVCRRQLTSLPIFTLSKAWLRSMAANTVRSRGLLLSMPFGTSWVIRLRAEVVKCLSETRVGEPGGGVSVTASRLL